MKKYIALLFFVFTITSIQAQTLFIKAKGYIDVRNGKLITPANILVEDGIIKSINAKKIPNGVEHIDLSNKILLPGLMDMHVHLDMNFTKNYELATLTENASKGVLRAAENAEKTLMAGFTTVRNVGQIHPTLELIDVALSEASNEGWIAAPRIIPCGHTIAITGGHADPSMGLGLAEGIMDLSPQYGIVDGPNEALKAVRYQIKNGAKALKIAATAGVLSLEESVGAQQLSNEEMKVIVEEANRHHVKVAAHAHGTQGIIAAVKAGVHSIEHGSLLNDEAINAIKEKGVFLVPTTGLVDIILASADKIDPKMAKKAKFILPKAKKSVTKAINAGVKIALGTDAPLIPHGSNIMELLAMIERGMSTTEALKTATINPAELLEFDDRGEIKTGFLADIIAVDTNPIEAVNTLKDVKFVMKGGVVYKNKK